jgi:lipopolysaccharide export system protein LptA
MVPVRIRHAAAAAAVFAAAAAAPVPRVTPRAANLPAPNVRAAPAAGVTTHDFRIETDQTNSNLNDGNFTMPHRVKFFRPGTDVVGDRAQGNYKAGTVTIYGHVVLHDNGTSVDAQKAGAAPGNGPATLSCDQLSVDSKRKLYIATGNVVYVQGPRRATAQSGRLDQSNHLLDLTGDVHLSDGDQAMSAQTVHYNTVTKDVSTSGNPVVVTGATAPVGSPLPGTTSTLPTPAAAGTRLPGRTSTLPTPAAKATP